MPAASETWKLPAMQLGCAACTKPLVAGAPVTTILDLAPDVPRRRDLCSGCGEAERRGSDGIFWVRALLPPAERRAVVDVGVMREVFERMLGRPEEGYRRLSYLIGLILVRKRLLRLRGFELQHGREVMLLVRPGEELPFAVPAPHLSAQDMVEARGQLGSLLATGAGSLDLDELVGGEPTRDAAAL